MRYKAIMSLCLAALILFMSACSSVGTGDETSSQPVPEDTPAVTESVTTAEETTVLPETTQSPHPVLTPVSSEDIPYFSGGMRRNDYDCGDGVCAKIINSVFENEYRKYIEGLPSQGYVQVSAREVGENYFYTFSREGTALIAAYFGAEDIARLTVLPYNPYDAYADIYGPQDTVLGAVEPLITMVNTGNNGEDTGMSYIIRTPEGSFIVIDGGWTGIGEGKKIRNLLRELNVGEGLPVVAAWILTHPHADHYGAIADVASAYYDEIVLERVIFNYMSDEMLAKSDVAKVLDDATSPFNILRKTLKAEKKWGYTQVIKPHTGDILNIDGVTVDILYTHEDAATDTSALVYNNAASLAFKVSVGNKSAIFFADSSAKNMLAMAKRYGSHLKSDILQPTHHGRTHGKIEVYSLVLPEVVMWPCAQSSYNEYKNQDYNQYLIKTFKRHYISQSGTVTLSFNTLEEIK